MTAADAVRDGVVIVSGPDGCIGAVFGGEEEAVVFIPASGDILLCGTEAWQDLNARMSGQQRQDDSTTPQAASPELQPLLATLQHLGVSVG